MVLISVNFDLIATKNQQFNGFTLIELLIVLAIIGLASGVAAPKLIKTYVRSSERAELQNFATKIKQLHLDAWKQGRNIRLPEKGTAPWPEISKGWTVKSYPSLYFLATGVTNGGTLILQASSERLWALSLTVLDGKVLIKPILESCAIKIKNKDVLLPSQCNTTV